MYPTIALATELGAEMVKRACKHWLIFPAIYALTSVLHGGIALDGGIHCQCVEEGPQGAGVAPVLGVGSLACLPVFGGPFKGLVDPNKLSHLGEKTGSNFPSLARWFYLTFSL